MKKIKICQCKKNDCNECNRGYLVWQGFQNIIREKILYYLKHFNIYYSTRKFKKIGYELIELNDNSTLEKKKEEKKEETLLNFFNNQYLYEIDLSYLEKNEKINLSILPKFIESIILKNNLNLIISPTNKNNQYNSQYNYNIKKLKIPYYYDNYLFEIINNIKSLKTLIIGVSEHGEKEKEFQINSFPNTLTELRLKRYRYQIKKGLLPESLEIFEICNTQTNNSSDKIQLFELHSLPKSIKTLIITTGDQFIIGDKLPNQLESFQFSSSASTRSNLKFSFIDEDSFNLNEQQQQQQQQQIEEKYQFKFPKSLINLKIITNSLELFNQISDCDQLNSLDLTFIEMPTIDKAMIEEFIRDFSDSIEKLSKNNKNLKHFILNSLSDYNYPFKLNKPLPNTLKSLSIFCDSIITKNNQLLLSEGLENLIFLNNNENIGFNKEIFPNQLPKSLKFINFGNSFNQKIAIDILPYQLKTIKFGLNFNQDLPKDSIPISCELLEILNTSYEKTIDLSNTNENLYIKLNKFNSKITNPSTLKKIFISRYSRVNQLNNYKIELLEFDEHFVYNQLSLYNFNDNIKILIFNDSFNGIIDLNYFKNLEEIVIKKDSNPIIKFKDQSIGNLKSIQISIKSIQFLNNLKNYPDTLLKLIKLIN